MTKTEQAAFLLPDFIDPKTWAAFVEMRKRMGQRAPLTPYAATLILNRLTALKAEGYCPNQCLEQSIERGWRGVFKTPNKPPPAPINGKPQITVTNDYLADLAERNAKLADPEFKARADAARIAAMRKLGRPV
jgi:hypothetical protein